MGLRIVRVSLSALADILRGPLPAKSNAPKDLEVVGLFGSDLTLNPDTADLLCRSSEWPGDTYAGAPVPLIEISFTQLWEDPARLRAERDAARAKCSRLRRHNREVNRALLIAKGEAAKWKAYSKLGHTLRLLRDGVDSFRARFGAKWDEAAIMFACIKMVLDEAGVPNEPSPDLDTRVKVLVEQRDDAQRRLDSLEARCPECGCACECCAPKPATPDPPR